MSWLEVALFAVAALSVVTLGTVLGVVRCNRLEQAKADTHRSMSAEDHAALIARQTIRHAQASHRHDARLVRIPADRQQ